MNEAKDLELEIVELGDATEVTKGGGPIPVAESNPLAPTRPE